MTRLQVGVVLVGERHLRGILHLLLVLLHELGVDLDLWGSESRGGDEFLIGVSSEGSKLAYGEGATYQARIADQLTSEPQERLLKVVVRLGGDIVVLQVLLAVESDGLGLHLALLNVDLVTAEDDGDTLADTDKVAWIGRSV